MLRQMSARPCRITEGSAQDVTTEQRRGLDVEDRVLGPRIVFQPFGPGSRRIVQELHEKAVELIDPEGDVRDQRPAIGTGELETHDHIAPILARATRQDLGHIVGLDLVACVARHPILPSVIGACEAVPRAAARRQ